MPSGQPTTQCSDCGVHVTLKNLARHRRIVHAAAQMNNDNAASDSTDSAYTGSGSSTSSCPGKYNVDDALTKAALEIAATSLLDQHHIYNEPELVKFLEENFPYVPPAERRALVVGAAAGARRAAGEFVTVQLNQLSHNPAKRRMAANSASALSFWNRGLGGKKNSSRHSSSTMSPVGGENADELAELHSISLADLQLPVSLEASSQGYSALAAAMFEPPAVPAYVPRHISATVPVESYQPTPICQLPPSHSSSMTQILASVPNTTVDDSSLVTGGLSDDQSVGASATIGLVDLQMSVPVDDVRREFDTSTNTIISTGVVMGFLPAVGSGTEEAASGQRSNIATSAVSTTSTTTRSLDAPRASSKAQDSEHCTLSVPSTSRPASRRSPRRRHPGHRSRSRSRSPRRDRVVLSREEYERLSRRR